MGGCLASWFGSRERFFLIGQLSGSNVAHAIVGQPKNQDKLGKAATEHRPLERWGHE